MIQKKSVLSQKRFTKKLNNLDNEPIAHPDDIDENTSSISDPLPGQQVVVVKKKKTKEYYVNSGEFTAELRKFYETDVITDNLAMMIKNIAYGLAHASNFINYTFKEDAIGDSLINMLNALRQKKYEFRPGGNPFSYFNSIAFNCWRSRIKKEKRNRDALAAYQEEVYSVIGPGVGVDDPVNPSKKNNEAN